MKVQGNRTIIRPLELRDVFEMRNWGYHKNPLLEDYNFPLMDDEEIKKWYKFKTNSFFNKYYGVLDKNKRLIGYLGIKDIKFIRRESTLGIVFDPNFVSKGYGTETLREYLNYYFNVMKMRRMYLEVAEFNHRAFKLYENIGFKPVGYYLDEFHNQIMDLNNSYYLENKSCFVIYNRRIYNYIYKMKLDKNDFKI
ncbi:MAG: GNAT family N-acetyltransferase [Tissierellaceae bacterium]|nr:GNAT family N-acetyltransferase [Tissierellaceae bacterium]